MVNNSFAVESFSNLLNGDNSELLTCRAVPREHLPEGLEAADAKTSIRCLLQQECRQGERLHYQTVVDAKSSMQHFATRTMLKALRVLIMC